MAKLSEESALGFPRAMAPQHFAELHRQGDLLPGSLRSVVMEEMVRRQRTKGVTLPKFNMEPENGTLE